MKYFMAILFFLNSVNLLHGQPDTIVVFDVRTQTIDLIPPVSYDSTITFESTSFSIGAMGNKVPLDLEPPLDNLSEGTQFTALERAELFFDVTSYPARTGVKLFGWRNDTLRNLCSGTMISENLVLTAAHCIFLSNQLTYDSILVAPAFDNGAFQQDIPQSIVEKYYLFKSYYERTSFDDIALLELKDPIGYETGWQGIAFNSNTSFFTENVFHKFSYPASPNPFDTTRVFNGDTLYYNYGLIDYFESGFIGVQNGIWLAAPGSSGSSIFYTDNQEYYAFGVLNFAVNFHHYLINQNVFYQFKNIIESRAVSVNEHTVETYPIIVYPNPATDIATVEVNNPENHRLSAILYDIQGRPIRKMDKITESRFNLHRTGLPSGIYILRVYGPSRVYNAKQIIFR